MTKKQNNKKEKPAQNMEFDPSGHRQRMKEQYEKNGFSSFRDYELLEMLLFFSIPRRDTRVLARRLLNTFGDLNGVFNASEAELCTIQGIGEKTAEFLCFFQQLSDEYLRRLRMDDFKTNQSIYHPAIPDYEAHRHLLKAFDADEPPFFSVLCKNSAGMILFCKKIEGSMEEALLQIKRLIAEKTTFFITVGHHLAHSIDHPDQSDLDAAASLISVSVHMDVIFQDYVIFTPDKMHSLELMYYLKGYRV